MVSQFRREVFVLLAAAIAAGCPAHAQSTESTTPTASFLALSTTDIPVVPSRIVAAVDDAKLVRLPGNTHYLARPEYDQGPVDPQLPLKRIQLVLQRSPEQEASLEKFMDEQQDPRSPNFHHWLQPVEFGKLYGPSDADMTAATSWLQNHGFEIYSVSKGRVTIEFSGTAQQVEQAFHTEIHNYLINGAAHISNTSDPEIPEALAPVIAGIGSLNDFFPTHASTFGGFVKRDLKTGKFTRVDSPSDEPKPLLTYNDTNDKIHNDVTPYDLATIYNILPLWSAGIDGTGQTIAIVGASDIAQSDVDTFRSSFGLPASTIKTVPNGADPGQCGVTPSASCAAPTQIENTLDVEWAGATAKNAKIVLVVSEATATTGAPKLSASYIVDNMTALIMSSSYQGCEAAQGAGGNTLLNSIYQQGAAEGISIFSAAGDAGSTMCDPDGPNAPATAVYGLNVNAFASSPYVTGVGGTDFDYLQATTGHNYWNSTNDPTTGATAKGYIPELPWDSTCTSIWLETNNPQEGTTTQESCENFYIAAYLNSVVRIEGGGGGVSSCISGTAGQLSTCTGGYAKPSWQKGTGVPGDKMRDVPDLSLFASGGWQGADGVDGSAYLLCTTLASPVASCDYSDPTSIMYQEVGGTSVAAPAMAGIMAMVLQKMGGKEQGLVNPTLYALAAKDNRTNCNTNTVASGNKCVFYDITTGTNAQVCTPGKPDCVTGTTSFGPDLIGIVTGYNSTVGYDQTTGLGSVNAYNLVNAWGSALETLTATLAPSLKFASTKVGSSSSALVATLKNTGTGSLTISSGGISITGTDASSFTRTTTCDSTLASGKTCTISVTFKPAKTGTLTATLEVADNATGSPQKVTLTGTGEAAISITLTPTTLTFPNTVSGTASDAQTVTVKNTGTSTATLTSITIAGTNPTSFFELNSCGSTLAAGAACSVFVAFDPLTASGKKATLSVADNASGSPQTVTLSGTGTAKAALTLSKTSLTFASTVEGKTTEEQSITVTNAGKSTVDITGITLTGTDSTSFVQLNTCGPALAAGANCVVFVAFKPAKTGSLTGDVSIKDSGDASPQLVKLSGTGAS